jgi:hypothetical protein
MPTLTRTVGPTQRVHQGLYLDWPKALVPEGGLTDGQNVEPDLGLMRQAPGWAKYSGTAVPGTGPVMLVTDFVKSDGTRALLACSTTRLSKYNSTTNVFDDVTGGANLLTGTAANPIFAGALNDLFVLTNGVNTLKKYDGTTWAALGGGPPASAVGLDIYEGHVLLWNVGSIGFRTQWSDLNAPETWGNGEAGILDVRDGNLSAILAGGKMRREFLLYKEEFGGVYRMVYVGGTLIMQVEELFPRFGVFAPRGVAVYRDTHFVMGADEQFYVITPGAAPQAIGDPVRKRVFARLNWNAQRAAWVAVNPLRQQVIFAVPEGSSATCTRAYLFHLTTGAWGERELPMMCGATVRDVEVTTIDDLSGTIDSLTGTINDLSAAQRQLFLLGGVGSSAYVQRYAAALTMDGTPVEAYVVGRWAGTGGRRSLRVRGVEVDHRGALTAALGTATSVTGTMTFTSAGNVTNGRADVNRSAPYVAPKFQGQASASEAWEIMGYRLDAFPQGRH